MKKPILLSIAMLFIFLCSKAQNVETVVIDSHIKDGLNVDPSGNIYTTSGGYSNGTTIGKYDIVDESYNYDFADGFNGPINIACYRDSLFVVSNYDNNTVYSYNLNSGVIDTLATGLDGPAGVVIDSADNIYVSNWGAGPSWDGHQIHRISASGVVTIYVDDTELYRPQGITINHLGELIVHSQQKLYKVDPQDSSLVLWSSIGYHIGNMTFRHKDSCIYGGNNQDHKIIKVDQYGNASVLAGMDQGYQDGDISEALFDSPLGIALSPTEDTLYIGEGGTASRLRRIVLDTTITGISETQNIAYNIYPNPFNQRFVLERESKERVQIELYDAMGTRVKQIVTVENRIIIDLSEYPSGVYLLKLFDKDGYSSRSLMKL